MQLIATESLGSFDHGSMRPKDFGILALGIAESGLFPGVVFYLSMWYKRNEQHYRVALFFSAASLAGAFGGILAWVWSSSACEFAY